jgi:hypothetical protein
MPIELGGRDAGHNLEDTAHIIAWYNARDPLPYPAA